MDFETFAPPDGNPATSPTKANTIDGNPATSPTKANTIAEALQIVGWREWAVLSLASNKPVRAKVDTGAASSSVHASNLVPVPDIFGRTFASFDLHLDEDRTARTRVHSHEIVGSRMVLSSSGHWSLRPVVPLSLRLGDTTFDTEVTLASRDEMEFRLLLGRSALRKRFCVDPSRSFVLGEPPCVARLTDRNS